ncbi:MAG: dNTP triphosphohydrolase, broad substrate specificity [uncultured Nocardioidaceae bacterium]|uniref:Deoxyguanosinetriphosphate triphosphohydrolase-like protein n=1 Tax=uncultured Nocardioidaceae bacterium TaxID=253824 RepID=A0A6J4KYZ3_9ACTN|nr:MAG: dNTP triphosphohydrolase, broad substrate specificity [uncultured Nocardioidaceae bacterium]
MHSDARTHLEPLAPGYPPDAGERCVPEPAKRPGRTAFQRDRARVLHSASLRRLAAKTQVLAPGGDDFVRNRLTHSLEVGQVARELGAALGCDPDLVETAALAHDLGHPPFGHNGERALDEVAADIGGFEGNAQTLRVLTRLEAKTARPDGSSVGLNLTRASLDACIKYPWTRVQAPEPQGLESDGSARAVRKFGVYDDDLTIYSWVRAAAAPGRRSIEAQVMDLADDVAYSVHDVEDALVAGWLDLTRLRDVGERVEVWEAVRDWYLPDVDDAVLEDALQRLQLQPGWPTAPVDGSRRSLAAVKQLTSGLIGRFCVAAHDATRAAGGVGGLTRYAADLAVPTQTRVEIGVLKGVAAHYVMRRHERVRTLTAQRALLQGLVEQLTVRGPDQLEPEFATDWACASSEEARLRVVVDQLASLTDTSARAWAARLL